MRSRRVRSAGRAAFVFLLLLSIKIVSGQSDTSSDENQISKLLTGLCDHTVKASDALDPSLSPALRKSNLEYFTDSYDLSLVPIGPIRVSSDWSATVPIKVEFRNANRELAVQSTALFVKRNKTWYYANFDFLRFPGVLIVLIVICGLVSLLYASGVLLLRWRLLQQGEWDWSNRIKIFIPIFWPSLLNTKRRLAENRSP